VITIEEAESDFKVSRLHDLLWAVLWRPRGLSKDIGKTFGLDGESLEFVALSDGVLVGSLIAKALTWGMGRQIRKGFAQGDSSKDQ
jgi:hypothetical protein